MLYTLLIALVVALAGCATTPLQIPLQNFDKSSVTVQKAVDPIAFAGLPTSGGWEQHYRTGNAFGAVVEFPVGEKEDGLENEFDFLLPFYDGYAVGKDGREFPVRAQFIRGGDCRLSMLFIVGGTKSPAGVKGVVASTLSDRLFRLRKELNMPTRIATFQPENLASGEYRRSFVLRQGTLLEGFEYVSSQKLAQLFASWKEVKGADHVGTFLVPPWVNYDEVNSVATLNPRYTFSEKFAGTASLTIVPSIIGTVGSGLMDVFSAARAPSRGRDMNSIPGERAEASKRVLDTLKSQCSPPNLTRR